MSYIRRKWEDEELITAEKLNNLEEGVTEAKKEAEARVPVTGGIMTGPLKLPGNPENDLEAAPKQYVDDTISYSAGEVKTGGTWIDGKPIYRQYFEGYALMTSTDPAVLGTIENFDKVINITGTCTVEQAGNIIPITWYYNATNRVDVYVANGKVVARTSFAYARCRVIVEYTKTTD